MKNVALTNCWCGFADGWDEVIKMERRPGVYKREWNKDAAGVIGKLSWQCLRSGVGKVTTHTPKRNYEIMQISVPEAVLQMDSEETIFSEPVETENLHAMGIGKFTPFVCSRIIFLLCYSLTPCIVVALFILAICA